MTPSAKKRADAVSARKAQKQARKGQISEIGKKRGAIEQAKVSETTILIFVPSAVEPSGMGLMTACRLDEAFQLSSRPDGAVPTFHRSQGELRTLHEAI